MASVCNAGRSFIFCLVLFLGCSLILPKMLYQLPSASDLLQYVGSVLTMPTSIAEVVDGLHYADSHEWVKVEGDVGTFGITDHAQVLYLRSVKIESSWVCFLPLYYCISQLTLKDTCC